MQCRDILYLLPGTRAAALHKGPGLAQPARLQLEVGQGKHIYQQSNISLWELVGLETGTGIDCKHKVW